MKPLVSAFAIFFLLTPALAQWPGQPAPPAQPSGQQPPAPPAPLPPSYDTPGIPPRAAASAYPVFRQQAQLTVGARMLSPGEVQQRFSSPIDRDYVVVEVGVFPSGNVKLRQQDFTLRGGDAAFFPSTPREVAAYLYPSPGGPGGAGPRRAAMVDVNGGVVEQELRDKSLPVGNLSQPVAGYLYFPVRLNRGTHYSLVLTLNSGTVFLPLPAPKD